MCIISLQLWNIARRKSVIESKKAKTTDIVTAAIISNGIILNILAFNLDKCINMYLSCKH